MSDADPPSARRPLLWRWLVNAVLLGASCVIAALLAEGTVRVVAPQQALPEWYRDDPVYGRSLKPTFHQRFEFLGARAIDVRTNSLGLRDDEPPPPGEGRPRILFLGDSFVFGYGIDVEERLDSQLREQFAAAGQSVTTINAGVPTWGTLQELAFARDHLDQFDPGAVVLVYCGNDQQNDRDFLAGRTGFREHGVVRLPGKSWLRMHSHLYRLALYATTAWRQAAANRSNAHEEEASPLDRQTASALTDEGWEQTRDAIVDFARELREKRPGTPLYLLATEPTDERIREHLRAMAQEPAIEFVDFRDRATELGEAARRLSYDPHWSPAMHALAAEALYDAMQGAPAGH